MPTSPDNFAALGEDLRWESVADLQVPPLKQDEVHLWAAPLSLSGSEAAEAEAWLNDHQRDRHQRLPKANQKMAYLAGRYFLLNLLAAYTQTTPDNISLAYSRLSKPHLHPNPHGLTFNFTDSNRAEGAVGLYAFYLGHEIGVDLESLARGGNFTAIAKRKFSTREQALTRRFDGELDPTQFLALWTRKEAYGKAKGVGVNFKMNQLDLASPESHHLSFSDSAGDGPYQLHQFTVMDDHIGSVCYAAEAPFKLKAFTPQRANVSDV